MKPIVFLILFFGLLGVFLSNAEAETFDMYVLKMPAHWQNQFGDLLPKATQYWENKTQGLTIDTVQHLYQADFVVEWASQYGEGKLGYYSTSTLNEYGKPKLTISLGFFKDKKWNLISPEYALELTKHELGHAIGMPYSTDPNDIMYPTIENYESWLQSTTEQKPKATSQYSKSTNWKAKSQKYQKLASEKISLLESNVTKTEALLDTLEYDNKGSLAEIEKAWTAFWWAKKYLNNAEKNSVDGGGLFLQSKYHDSFSKYKNSYELAKQIEAKLLQITKHIEKADELQYGIK